MLKNSQKHSEKKCAVNASVARHNRPIDTHTHQIGEKKNLFCTESILYSTKIAGEEMRMGIRTSIHSFCSCIGIDVLCMCAIENVER